MGSGETGPRWRLNKTDLGPATRAPSCEEWDEGCLRIRQTDFLGGPVAGTTARNAGDPGLIPGPGTKDPACLS